MISLHFPNLLLVTVTSGSSLLWKGPDMHELHLLLDWTPFFMLTSLPFTLITLLLRARKAKMNRIQLGSALLIFTGAIVAAAVGALLFPLAPTALGLVATCVMVAALGVACGRYLPCVMSE